MIVRTASCARLALQVAAPRRVLLLSPPDAATGMGVGWFLAIAAAADAVDLALLDCGVSPGHALEAIRLGARRIVLARSVPAHGSVAAAAAERGVEVWTGAPPAFDPGRAGLRGSGARRRWAAWLAAQGGVGEGEA